MSDESLADILRRLRLERGTSLRAAARELSVDPAYLSRVERGHQRASSSLTDRAAEYYADPGVLRATQGSAAVPEDVARIINHHPDLVEEIRRRFPNG